MTVKAGPMPEALSNWNRTKISYKNARAFKTDMASWSDTSVKSSSSKSYRQYNNSAKQPVMRELSSISTGEKYKMPDADYNKLVDFMHTWDVSGLKLLDSAPGKYSARFKNVKFETGKHRGMSTGKYSITYVKNKKFNYNNPALLSHNEYQSRRAEYTDYKKYFKQLLEDTTTDVTDEMRTRNMELTSELSEKYIKNRLLKMVQTPADFIDFVFNTKRYDKQVTVAECKGGHIAKLEYNANYQALRVTFRNREDVVVFFDLPANVAGNLIHLARSNAMAAPKITGTSGLQFRVKERHAVGVEFWNLVRIRGTVHGTRYQFQYQDDYRTGIIGGRRAGTYDYYDPETGEMVHSDKTKWTTIDNVYGKKTYPAYKENEIDNIISTGKNIVKDKNGNIIRENSNIIDYQNQNIRQKGASYFTDVYGTKFETGESKPNEFEERIIPKYKNYKVLNDDEAIAKVRNRYDSIIDTEREAKENEAVQKREKDIEYLNLIHKKFDFENDANGLIEYIATEESNFNDINVNFAKKLFNMVKDNIPYEGKFTYTFNDFMSDLDDANDAYDNVDEDGFNDAFDNIYMRTGLDIRDYYYKNNSDK